MFFLWEAILGLCIRRRRNLCVQQADLQKFYWFIFNCYSFRGVIGIICALFPWRESSIGLIIIVAAFLLATMFFFCVTCYSVFVSLRNLFCPRIGEEHAIKNISNDERPEVIASIQRLSSPEYLDFLLKKGVDIPDYFFKKIGHHKMTKQEKDASAYQDLLHLQEITRQAKELLRDETALANAANAAGENVEEFREMCYKRVKDYPDIHREFNIKHSPCTPIPEDLNGKM